MSALQTLLSPDPEVIVFNLKKRYTGVSATINALVPFQAQQWRLGFCGVRMSNGIDGMTAGQAIALSRQPPPGRAFRIWHVRRDPEMMLGIFARDVLRLPIRLVFTSAAQHLHGRFPRWLISKMDAVISTTPLAASFVPTPPPWCLMALTCRALRRLLTSSRLGPIPACQGSTVLACLAVSGPTKAAMCLSTP